MPFARLKFLIASSLMISLLATIGCDLNEIIKRKKPYAYVSGKVVANGQPIAGAKIYFLPLATNEFTTTRKFAYARSNSDGSFIMRVSESEYGAYIGDNLVWIGTGEFSEEESSKELKPERITREFNTESKTIFKVSKRGNRSIELSVELIDSPDASPGGETQAEPKRKQEKTEANDQPNAK